MIGQKVADWAKRTLIIPAGHASAGQPLILPDYLVRFFDEVFQPGVIEGGLSVARKNAKSTGCAALLLYFLCEGDPGWRGAVLSTTGKTAAVMLEIVMALVESSGLQDQVVKRWRPEPGMVICKANDAICQFYNASKSSALGANLDLAIADEYGEFDEKSRRNVEMLVSSMPLRGGKLIGIGVQAHSHLFQELKSRSGRSSTVWHEYVGRADLPVDDAANLRLANPAIDAGIMPLENLLTAAARAKGAPATEYDFRKYHLNLPATETKDVLISAHDFRAKVLVDDLPPREGLCSLGIDIGYSESMTAGCAYWSATGRLETYAAVPAIPSLYERGLADGVGDLYANAADRGELAVHAGRVTNVQAFVEHLSSALAGSEVEAVADDYRSMEVIEALDTLGLGWQIDFRRVGRGRDGQRDILESQKLMLSGAVKTRDNLILGSAIRLATLRFSSSNNFCELVKYKSNARIDAAQALVLALGHGGRLLAQPEAAPVSFFVA